MRKRLLSLLLALLVLRCLCVTVSAHSVPDLVDGSITFNVSYGDVKINDGTLTIYKVGDIAEDDGNYFFRLSAEIDPEEPVVEDPTDQALAKELAQKVQDKKLKGTAANIKDGEAVFDPVEHGLYVVVQTTASSGYEPLAPFLISQPNYEDGIYKNDVEAKPKTQLETAPPTESTQATKPGEKLPQTGQLNWPIPMLTAGGLLLFAIGWALRFGRKKDNYEK